MLQLVTDLADDQALADIWYVKTVVAVPTRVIEIFCVDIICVCNTIVSVELDWKKKKKTLRGQKWVQLFQKYEVPFVCRWFKGSYRESDVG